MREHELNQAVLESSGDQPTFPIDNQQSTIDNSTIWSALALVMDPEIPVLSVVDMGMIAGVCVEPSGVTVDLTPTFAGCPAIDLIRREIIEAVRNAGAATANVRVVYDPPWTSDRISAEGRAKLKEFGLAPPGAACSAGELEKIPCPHCDSKNTEMESLFGPTLCRSIHYCHDCLQSFEHFKPV